MKVRRLQVGRKAGQNPPPIITEVSYESSESSEAPDDSTDESDTEHVSAREVDPSPLINVVEPSFPPTLRMMIQETKQLPFLVRNLRAGFASRCQLFGVPTASTKRVMAVHVTFRVQMDHGLATLDYPDEYKNQQLQDSLACPLCNLHGNFKTKEMLQKHLEWDHPEVETRWTLEVSCHLSQTL